MTDAALVLGYLDPANFLGGAMRLQIEPARQAIAEQIAKPLGLSTEDAAAAIIDVVTQNMVNAIEEATVKQGIDPSEAVLIGGGGAAGFNSVLIARRLDCPTVVIPETGAALSAAGALMSDLTSHFSTIRHMSTHDFDFAAADAILTTLRTKCEAFVRSAGDEVVGHSIELRIEGHYPSQVWDIEFRIPSTGLRTDKDVEALVALFHAAHEDLFAFADHGAPIEIVSWQAHVSCRLRESGAGRVAAKVEAGTGGRRQCYFTGHGMVEATVRQFDTMAVEETVTGPAIVELSADDRGRQSRCRQPSRRRPDP